MKKETIASLPSSCGVYVFRNTSGKVIYVGKAANIKRRVQSYFRARSGIKIEKLVSEIDEVSFENTDTVIEALIKEAELIKKHRPEYNIKGKDDSSFLYVVITDEDYPRLLLSRGPSEEGVSFGPFVSSSDIRQALRIIRKIFPFHTHTKSEIKKGKPCLYYQIGLCPGVCAGKIDKISYMKDIRKIKLFFEGKKKVVIENLKKEMKKESKALRFEEAEKLMKKINALLHVYDTALISGKDNETKGRIEGYDISNISGMFAVGSMVVFEDGVSKKSDYKKFKIRSSISKGDTAMIKEVIERRFNNDWPLPDLLLVDGGEGQVNVAKEVLYSKGISLPVAGIAKGKDRKKDRLLGDVPKGINKKLLLSVRDEAHRFALKYHRETIRKSELKNI